MENNSEMNSLYREKKIFNYECVDLAKTFPEWKSPLLTVDYIFIQTYQEVINAKTKMDEKEKEAEFYNSEMTNKWIELKKKQEDFLNDVENYNAFFTENEKKCQRIHSKVITEREFQKKCKQEISDVTKRNECLDQLENNMKRWVHSLKPFHDHLTSATKQMEQFPDVGALINYYILLNSETKLQEKFIAHLLKSEQLQNQLLKSLKEKMNLLSQQRSELLLFKKYYQSKTYDLNDNNEKWKQKKSQANVMVSENIYMKQAFDNIFQKLCRWKRKHFTEMNDNRRLVFIENTIYELKNTVQLAYELSYKDNISNRTDSSFITQKK